MFYVSTLSFSIEIMLENVRNIEIIHCAPPPFISIVAAAYSFCFYCNCMFYNCSFITLDHYPNPHHSNDPDPDHLFTLLKNSSTNVFEENTSQCKCFLDDLLHGVADRWRS